MISNTNNWSGSVQRKAPLSTDDWSGFLSQEDEIRLSSQTSSQTTCNCLMPPCNCGGSDVSLGLDPIDTDVQTEVADPLPNMQMPMSDKKNLSWLTLVGLGMLGYFVYKKLKK